MCNSSISFYQFSPLSNKDLPAPPSHLNSTQLNCISHCNLLSICWRICRFPSPPLSPPSAFSRLFSALSFFICNDTKVFFFILTDWHMSVCACVWEWKCVPTVMGVAVCSANVAAAIAVAFCNCNSILTIFQLCYWHDWRFDDWWFVAASGQGNTPSTPSTQFQLA